MVPFRYHLTSLVAVFLALGIGLAAGASLAGDGRLGEEQVAIIREIEASLEGLRAENLALQERLRGAGETLSFYDQVLAAAGDALFGKGLDGLTVALFADAALEEPAGEVRTYLQRFGAAVPLFTWRAAAPGGVEGGRDLTDEQLAALADLLTTGTVPDALSAFVADGTLRVDALARPAQAFVVLQAEATQAGYDLAERLAGVLAARGRSGVIGKVGPRPVRQGAAPVRGVWETVPFVETLAGRVGLAAALAAAAQAGEAP